jgi:hypothetical protein
VLAASVPFVAAFYLARMATRGTLGRNWRQRLGLLRAGDLGALRPDAERIWVHAVSAGETAAAAPVITELARLRPQADVVLSTTTPAGQRVAPKAAPQAAATIYFPIDLPFSAAAALGKVRPTLCVQVEAELWPNFLALARRRGAVTAVVNGRVWRTARPGRIWRQVMGWTLAQVDLLCMQSQADADRVIQLGADPRRVLVTGNTKFDQAGPAGAAPAAAAMRAELGLADDDLVLLAGSTHPGEEQIVLDAFRIIAAQEPRARLMIAPRHIERTSAVEAVGAGRWYCSTPWASWRSPIGWRRSPSWAAAWCRSAATACSSRSPAASSRCSDRTCTSKPTSPASCKRLASASSCATPLRLPRRRWRRCRRARATILPPDVALSSTPTAAPRADARRRSHSAWAGRCRLLSPRGAMRGEGPRGRRGIRRRAPSNRRSSARAASRP